MHCALCPDICSLPHPPSVMPTFLQHCLLLHISQQQAHMQRSSSSRPLPQPPAAAAADLTASVLPYISPRAPKLHSRRMQGSPMDGLWGAASAALLRLELAAAAAVDRHARYGPLVASCLAGVAAGMVRGCRVACCDDAASRIQTGVMFAWCRVAEGHVHSSAQRAGAA